MSNNENVTIDKPKILIHFGKGYNMRHDVCLHEFLIKSVNITFYRYNVEISYRNEVPEGEKSEIYHITIIKDTHLASYKFFSGYPDIKKEYETTGYTIGIKFSDWYNILKSITKKDGFTLVKYLDSNTWDMYPKKDATYINQIESKSWKESIPLYDIERETYCFDDIDSFKARPSFRCNAKTYCDFFVRASNRKYDLCNIYCFKKGMLIVCTGNNSTIPIFLPIGKAPATIDPKITSINEIKDCISKISYKNMKLIKANSKLINVAPHETNMLFFLNEHGHLYMKYKISVYGYGIIQYLDKYQFD